VLAGFGAFIVVAWLADSGSSICLTVFTWFFALLFVVWGLVLVSRCLVSAQSPFANISEKIFPDAAVDAEGLVVLFVLMLVPAALVTFALRWLGVKGERWSRGESSKSATNQSAS
jgi:hypothetical protein